MQPNTLIYHKNMQIPKVSWTCFACNILCVCCVLLQVCRQTEIRWSWIDELRKQNEEQDRQGLWHGVSRLNHIMLQMLCRCRLKLCTYGPPAAVCHAAEEPYTRRPLIDVRIDILGWSGKTWATCQRLWECLSIIVMSWEVCRGKTEEQGKTRAQYSQGKESHLIHIVMH